jgi:stage V sporulation protein AB
MIQVAANLTLVIIGLAGGLAVGSGIVAFLVVLDVIPRLAQLTRSYSHIYRYEVAVIMGTLAWSILDFGNWKLSLGVVGTVICGLASGCFIGLLAAALTEVVNVLPILAKRLHMMEYMKFLLTAMVLGKMIGSLFDWLVYV